MRLLADENIAAPLVQALREAGNDVTYIAELAPGLTDDAVLSLATHPDSAALHPGYICRSLG